MLKYNNKCGVRIMSKQNYNSKNIKKVLKSKPNQTIFEHYGLKGKNNNGTPILRLANHNAYLKVAYDINNYLKGSRQETMRFLPHLKRYGLVAEQYANEVRKLYMQEKYKDDKSDIGAYMSNYSCPEVPYFKLTKNGKIKPEYIAETLTESANTFNVEDNVPISLKALTTQIISAPKTIEGEMCFNAIGDHDRPCFVSRKILSCRIDNKTYMLLSDEKYYQNSPTVAYPLTLLYAGEIGLPCQAYRIDSVAHLDPDMPKSYGLDIEFNMPDYLVKKFEGNHQNVTPADNHGGTKLKKISASSHIHERDANFELMHRCAYMVNGLKFRNSPCPDKFLTFNAREIDIREFVEPDFNKHSQKGLSFGEQLEAYNKASDKLIEIAKSHKGIIPTQLLQEYYAKKYNITNYEINPEFCEYFDKIRSFTPERLATMISPEVVGKHSYPTINCPVEATTVQQARKMIGKIIDYDYVLEHDRKDVIEYYRTQKEARIKKETEPEPETKVDDGPTFTM